MDNGLSKVLKGKDVIALAFGAMIGWGWIVTTGSWIDGAGSLGAIIAFAIGGTLVALVGLTYAELVSAMPKVGGEHIYTFRAMGSTISFIATWALILGYMSVIAFEAVALPTAIEYLFPDFSTGYLWTVANFDVNFTWALVGIVASMTITWINYIGIRFTTIVQAIFTVMIMLAGTFLIFGGGVSGSQANMSPLFKGDMAGILTVVVMTPFMFVGFDVIPQSAEEINLKRKNIGKLLIFSVFLASFWYIAIIWGVSRILPRLEVVNSSLVTADAMGAAYGSNLMAGLMVIGGIGGILTSWIGFYVGGSRAIYAMARAKMLPAFLGKVHPKYKSPSNAILLIGVLSTISPLFGEVMLTWLVNAGGLGLTIAWFLVALSFLILRHKEPDMERPFFVPAGKLVGWVTLILCLGIMFLYFPGASSALAWPYEWMIILLWGVLGIVFYVWSKKKYGLNQTTVYLNEEIQQGGRF